MGNLVPKIFQCYRLGGDSADSRRPMRDQSEVIPGDYSPLRVGCFLGLKTSPYQKTGLQSSSKQS